MKIESTTKIERWEQFRDLSVKVVSVVASEFPHPVELNQEELLGPQAIGSEERFVCTETVKRRRALRAKLMLKIVEQIELRARLLVQEGVRPGESMSASWLMDFQREVDFAATKIEKNPQYRTRWIYDQSRSGTNTPVDLSQTDFNPRSYVTLWDVVGTSKALDDRLKIAVIEATCSILGEAGAPTPMNLMSELAEYLLSGKVHGDLRRSTEEAPHWLTSTDSLMVSSQSSVEILFALKQHSFDEACAGSSLHDWARVESLRNDYLERQDKNETLAGTILYLVDSGILLKKQIGEVVRYTLSPAMVAPLMASTASGSGDSGFKVLSKLRTATTPAFKELAKEAAQIVFTSATIGIGKLALGG